MAPEKFISQIISLKLMHMIQFRFFSTVILMITCSSLYAQGIDLFAEQPVVRPEKKITTAIFKSTRIINGQSIENVGAGILDFRILHRFGNMTQYQSAYNLFGLDQASIRFGLDYGLTSRLMVGVGRSTFQKQFDGFVKYRLIRQQSGRRNIPFSISLYSSINYKSLKDNPIGFTPYLTDRLTFSHQVLIASKIGDYFSVQLTPTMIHYNLVDSIRYPNDFYSLGAGFRLRLSKRVNLTGEYFYRFDKLPGYNDPISVGFDIETGGHVFQLHITNSTGMTDRTFINETRGNWGSWRKSDIRIGFNISRVFTVKKPKELRGIKW